MKNFVIVANQDRGKSYFIKNDILKKFHHRRNFIYDVNLEYPEFKNELKGLPEIDEFLSIVPLTTHPPSKCNVIFEEATGFFSTAGVPSNKIKLHIFRRFHTQNINVFVFHSLLVVPDQILNSIDFFVIFRTPDPLDKVQSKYKAYPKVVEAFKEVQERTNNTFFNREKKTYPDEYSKKWFHFKKIVSK